MILALDTDVIIHWAVPLTARHLQARELVKSHIRSGGGIGLTPQVLHEFLHVSTDSRRLSHPLEMPAALEIAAALWEGAETVRLLPSPLTLTRTLDLMASLGLGRKRILDTALAATLEQCGVVHLATLNRAFLKLVSP